jgi:hypothetical protein
MNPEIIFLGHDKEIFIHELKTELKESVWILKIE